MNKNVFGKHQQKIALKNKIYFYGFYTILLYFMALTIILISKPNQICFTSYLCADSSKYVFFTGFILYLYILIFAVVIVHSFKVLEKVLQHKNHLNIFKGIFIVIPLLTGVYVWLSDTESKNGILLILFTAIISIMGLLMIELRKK